MRVTRLNGWLGLQILSLMVLIAPATMAHKIHEWCKKVAAWDIEDFKETK